MKAWTAQHVSYLKMYWEGVWSPGSLLQAQESQMTKRSLFSCFHSTKKAALFLLRVDTPTLFLLSNRLSLPTVLICPCPPAMPGAASTHSVQPPGARLGSPTANASLSIALSLCRPRCKTKDPQGQHVPTSALTWSVSPAQPPLRPLWWVTSVWGCSRPHSPPAPRMLGARDRKSVV